MASAPGTLQEAILYFADYGNCKDFLAGLRWPDGTVHCPECGSSKVTYLANARLWKCYAGHDRPKFSLKTGTIMEDSPLGLDKWLTAMWLIVNCKNGVSSCEIARDLDITQKTAWFLDHRIRLAFHGGSIEKLSGKIEADETFIGGKARFMHKDRKERRRGGKGKAPGPEGKTIVAAVLERGGRVRTVVVDKRRKKQLHELIHENVEAGSELFTDDLKSYEGLESEYIHQVINHAEAYVKGQVHTNGMENFWSLLKRGLNGTYVSVEPYHLFRYMDEQAYRYNNRKMDDFERFKMAASHIVGRRITWDQLTGKQPDYQTAIN